MSSTTGDDRSSDGYGGLARLVSYANQPGQDTNSDGYGGQPREFGYAGSQGSDRIFGWLVCSCPPAQFQSRSFWRAFVLGQPVYAYGLPPAGLYPTLLDTECDGVPTYNLNTVNNTPTAIFTASMPDLTALTLRVTVTAAQVGGGDSGSWSMIASYFRNGGAPAPVGGGSTTVLAQRLQPLLSTLDAYFDVSGNDVRLMVVGLGASVDWTAVVETAQAT